MPPTTLAVHHGQLLVRDWPDALRPPFGLERHGDQLTGPARLRWRVRDALERARLPFTDTTTGPTAHPIEHLRSQHPPPPLPWSSNLRLHGHRGILIGLGEADRLATIHHLLGALQAPTVLITADCQVSGTAPPV